MQSIETKDKTGDITGKVLSIPLLRRDRISARLSKAFFQIVWIIPGRLSSGDMTRIVRAGWFLWLMPLKPRSQVRVGDYNY